MIKAAVVGVGYLGTFHAEKYTKTKMSSLCAVVDVDGEKSKKAAKKFKAQALTDYRALPELGVQCASVVSDTTTHFEISKWLLEHGVDVLVEKPMATSYSQAKELIAIAKAHRRILQVGHLERFNPAFQAVKSILTKPRFFEARRIAPFAGRGHDVDVVADLMIHDIDIIAHLVGRPLLKVDAVGIPVLTNSVDIANARLTFEGGAIANVTASRAATKSERTIRIFQPDLYVSLDFGDKKIKMCKRKEEVHPTGLRHIDVSEEKITFRDALQDEIESFLYAVQTREEPVVSGEDGLRALEIVEKIRTAFKESVSLLDGQETTQARVANL